MRRAEQRLEVLGQLGLGQEREDPAAVVVDHDERGVDARGRAAPSRPLLSWRKQRSPSSATVGAVARRRRRRARSTRSRRCRSRHGWRGTRRRRGAGRSSRRRAPACSTRRRARRRRAARPTTSRATRPSNGSSHPSSSVVDRGARALRRRRASASSHVVVDHHVDRVGERAEQQLGIGDHPPAHRVLRVEPRVVGIDEHLVDVGARATACATLLVGGAPMRSTTSGRCAVGEPGTAQQRVVGRDRAGDAQARDRVGEHRPAGRSANARARVAGRTPRTPARDDEPAWAGRRPGAPARRASRPTGARTPGACARPRAPVGPTGRVDERRRRSAPAARGTAGSGAPGPAGAPSASATARDASARHSAPTPGRSSGTPGVVEPAHRVAVELHLVDGLAGAGVAQLGRAVGGAHDQRHAAVVGLEHRGVEVGRGGARRAQHDRGTPARPRRARARRTRPSARRGARAAGCGRRRRARARAAPSASRARGRRR